MSTIGSTASLGAQKLGQVNQNWVGGNKVPMPGVSGVSFKDVAATQGVFNNLKTNSAPKVNLLTK
jgi:hypothetical protein